MKQKTLTVELTPEERDILHSALLNHRLFIERQMDDEKNALRLHRVLLLNTWLRLLILSSLVNGCLLGWRLKMSNGGFGSTGR